MSGEFRKDFYSKYCQSFIYNLLVVLKMIKQDNLDDINKFYLKFYEVDNFFLENFKMGRK